MWPICIREKHIFHNDISPHFKFSLFNERLDFCEFFSLIIFTKCANIFGHDCLYVCVCMYISAVKVNALMYNVWCGLVYYSYRSAHDSLLMLTSAASLNEDINTNTTSPELP